MSFQCAHDCIHLHGPPPSDTFPHADIHTRSYSSNKLLHTHSHTIRPWLATSGPQVTDVSMRQGDSNEYWITAVMQYPVLTHNVSHFCPPALFQDFRVKLTLFFQMDPFGPPGTPVLLSSRDFPFLDCKYIYFFPFVFSFSFFSSFLSKVWSWHRKQR